MYIAAVPMGESHTERNENVSKRLGITQIQEMLTKRKHLGSGETCAVEGKS